MITRTGEKKFERLPCAWARWLLRHGEGVVWDTETTGLGEYAKIVSMAVVDFNGEVLFDRLINPGCPIPKDATAIHGITDAMVANAATFKQVFPEIREVLINRRWVIYNKGYDVPRLQYECNRAGVLYPMPAQCWYDGGWWMNCLDDVWCAMEMYAIYHGDFSEYHGNYKWQKLSDAARRLGIRVENAHSALADTLTTLALIQKLALREDREENEHGELR